MASVLGAVSAGGIMIGVIGGSDGVLGSGVLHAAQNHQGNPNAGGSYELDAIAAVVIGGTSLAGGSGSIPGTVVGTLITGILTNMLRLNNVDSNTELMLKAVIILAAVWIQQLRIGPLITRKKS